jgi:hypothetical protein
VRSKARRRMCERGRGRRRCRRDLQCLLTSKVFDAGGEEEGGRMSGWRDLLNRRQVWLQASGSKSRSKF